MATPRERHSVVIALDVRLPFEALILNRLMALPREHRQGWLRELLVNGFRHHCAGLRSVQQGENPRGFRSTGALRPNTQCASPTPPALTAAPESKPFAALRHVIG